MMQNAVSASGKCDKEENTYGKEVSCCGIVCSDCKYYLADCRGCGAIKGRGFWLEYTGESCCDIYECCVNQRKCEHCGQREEFKRIQWVKRSEGGAGIEQQGV